MNEYEEQINSNIRRIGLCTSVIEEVRSELLMPLDPSQKAHMLILTENLIESAFHLAEETRELIWSENTIPPTPLS